MRPKLTSMMWRFMAEGLGLGLVLFAVSFGSLYWFSMLAPIDWQTALRYFVTTLALATITGAAYGFWNSYRLKRRLELLREMMLHLEKGHLSPSMPPLGEDEIGRLGELLDRIRRKWEEQVTSLQRLSTHNAELAEKARYTAVIEERQRLARELHDAVSQQLFAISMTATGLGRTLDKDVERARKQVALIEEMASVAQSEMRALLLHLRPVRLEGKSFTEALKDLLQELSAKARIDVHWEMDEDVRLAKGVEDQLFRIAQEALSNTLRHSRASRLEMKMSRRPDGIRLVIRDNGVGFDLNQKKQTSYGLASMSERVSEIGGVMNIVTAPGKGTRLEIRVPLPEATNGGVKDDSNQSSVG